MGRLSFPGEKWFQGGHPRPDKKERRIILRYQGKTGHHQVPFAGKKIKKSGANIAALHFICNPLVRSKQLYLSPRDMSIMEKNDGQ